ncbi:MAG: FtsX-like permease family protein [Desulfobacter postgatei]|uniref:ABC transporter permease n=1 Tax=Desulfobacter postgatei TaxID=2293 RepID=UPI0023F024B6|nr:FtsX-like permease family protein [Desulfobacter postgatei]MDD4272108.1 FtsX-like permease family protein [Desulfobacter postgatei]
MNILKILVRNAFRHKLRSILTIIAMCIAILAFGLLRTVISAWYAGVAASSADRLVTRNAISLIFPLPLAYRDKIRLTDGVKGVSYGNWFGGIYIEEKNFFANFAVEPQTYLALYPEFILPADQLSAFLTNRKACIAGARLAERFGWKIGDTITLKGTIFPGNWELLLQGIYRGRDQTVDQSMFFFHWEYLNESLKKTASVRANQVGYYIIQLTDPERAAEVCTAIDKNFKNSLAETLTETEKAFQMSFVAMSDALIWVIQIVSGVIIVIILAVVANTMAMTTRERIGEYAIYKTLGFGAFYIWGLIWGEALVITLSGGLLGMVLTYPVTRVFSNAVGTVFPVFNVDITTIYMDLGVALTVGTLATILPARHACKISIADGLRRVD